MILILSLSAGLSAASVQQHSTYEGQLTASNLLANPFELVCHVVVDGPSTSRHAKMNITMFYDGGYKYGWRFTPDAVGEWHWTSVCAPGFGLDHQQGTVQSTPAPVGARLGAIMVDPSEPTQLVYASGKPYVLVGLELDWLWATGLLNGTSAMQSVVSGLAAIGVNHVLVQIYAHSTSGSPLPPLVPPRVSPTPTTPWASADQLTLDLDFWHNYEAMLEMLAEANVIAHVMFYVGNKNVGWPAAQSAADDLYWITAMARLGAYPSVVLDVSKEAGSANAGRPTSYFVERMRLMQSMNAHGRILTSHSGFDWSNRCDAAPELCEVISAQIHLGDNKGIAEVAPLYHPFLAQAAVQATTPYINVEFFYQWGPVDGCHFSCCNACTNQSNAAGTNASALSAAPAAAEANLNEMRRVMWDNYMAGAAIAGACWYHDDLGWDILDPRALDWRPATSTASQMATLRTLRAFWESVPRRDFDMSATELCVGNVQPATAVIHCLARRNGTVTTGMILHIRTAKASFKVLGLPAQARLDGYWLDPASTDSSSVPFVAGGVQQQPVSFEQDAILYVAA